MGSALFCCEGNLAGSFVGLCKGVGGDLSAIEMDRKLQRLLGMGKSFHSLLLIILIWIFFIEIWMVGMVMSRLLCWSVYRLASVSE